MAVEGLADSVVAMVVRGSVWLAYFLDVTQRDGASSATVMNDCRRLCGEIRAAIPGRLESRFTAQPAKGSSLGAMSPRLS